jgi:hypothetical protein
MLFNAHSCNHILLQSGGGTWGTGLYTVRGVGSGSRDVDAWRENGSVRQGSGAPSTDGPEAWLPTPPDQRIRHRIQIGMFRSIRVDHTNCLQVAIKTHSFIFYLAQMNLTIPSSAIEKL